MSYCERHGLPIADRVRREIQRAEAVRRASERWRLAQLRGYGQAVMHLNGDATDNRPENLRVVDLREGGRG